MKKPSKLLQLIYSFPFVPTSVGEYDPKLPNTQRTLMPKRP